MLTEGDLKAVNPAMVKTGAALSQQSYKSAAEWGFNVKEGALGLPARWKAVPRLSVYGGDGKNPDRAVQMITFENEKDKIVILDFKGSSNPKNFESDLIDDGYSAYRSQATNVNNIIEHVKTAAQYKGYTIYVAGHSLGGGEAMTAALRHNLSGYTYNSLPVSDLAIQHEFGGEEAYKARVEQWKETGHTLVALTIDHDIATFFYHHLRGKNYINTTTLVFDYPFETPKKVAQRNPFSPRGKQAEGGEHWGHMGELIPVEVAVETLRKMGHDVYQLGHDLRRYSPSHVKIAIKAHMGSAIEEALRRWETEGYDWGQEGQEGQEGSDHIKVTIRELERTASELSKSSTWRVEKTQTPKKQRSHCAAM